MTMLVPRFGQVLAILAFTMAAAHLTETAGASAPVLPPAAETTCSTADLPSPVAAAACLTSEMAPVWSSSKGRPGQPY